MLLNELLKEHRKVENQSAEIGGQRNKIESLESTVAKQQEQIEALMNGLRKVSAEMALTNRARKVATNQ